MKEGKSFYYVALIACIAISGILYVFFVLPKEAVRGVIVSAETKAESNLPSSEESASKQEMKVVVELCGAVNQPGILELKADARVYEAVIMAGGLTEVAAYGVVNQARILVDGEMIYFPTKQEVDTGQYDVASNDKKSLVNINTASLEELMTLPGIGESKANGIISYRKSHNEFNSIEEIMKVDGIKQAAFDKIKDYITK